MRTTLAIDDELLARAKMLAAKQGKTLGAGRYREAVVNIIPVAYIARVHDCPVATFDRDLRRFDDLEIVEPGLV